MTTQLILKPVVTEKSMRLAETGRYTFFVPGETSKIAIAKLVSELYKVTVESVRIAKLPGKPKRRGAVSGFTSPKTKAIVALTKGQTIPGYELALETPEGTKADEKASAAEKKTNPAAKAEN
ncbi:50S ribosomal protein L23 [Candidatus Berkelbacteria bacterium]|nr:50S ribosomal protein L23 [Candidatus Berkelbacteria bacterium]